MIDRRAILGLLAGGASYPRGCAFWELTPTVCGVPGDEGVTEIEWLSSSSFRGIYRLGRGPRTHLHAGDGRVEVKVRSEEGRLEFSTRYLRVVVERNRGTVRVHDAAGKLLLADIRGPRREGERIVWERERQAGERFWGLGPEASLDGRLGIRGLVETTVPFLMSSKGYGEYFRPAGSYSYLFAEGRRVEAPARVENEFYFYYGPTPKEILEEHAAVESRLAKVDSGMFRPGESPPPGTWPLPNPRPDGRGLTALIRSLLRSSYSAILFPAIDLSIWRRAKAEVRERALQLAVYVPVVYSTLSGNDAREAEVARERERWMPFLLSYGYEAQERGFPLVRPLGVQYPTDPHAIACGDAFMLGDEILVAPVTDTSQVRSVYLPAGEWTEWSTNVRFGGRQVIEAPASPERIPVFAKNGSVVPVAEAAGGQRVAVHYFPRLAGEFFYYEDDGALTQLHAAPAGELVRLEIEPARERFWEWVVHHVRRPARIWAGESEMCAAKARAALGPNQWWYDQASGNLHILVQPPAGSDHVLYAAF